MITDGQKKAVVIYLPGSHCKSNSSDDMSKCGGLNDYRRPEESGRHLPAALHGDDRGEGKSALPPSIGSNPDDRGLLIVLSVALPRHSSCSNVECYLISGLIKRI